MFAFCFYVLYGDTKQYQTTETLNKNIKNAGTKEGRKLMMTTCYQCHFDVEENAFSGRKHGNPKRLGDFYSANITNDTLTGIGSWTVDELYYFFRTGIKKNGELAFDMPKYPLLSDKDLLSLIAFLKSDDPLVRPISYKVPLPQYSFITKMLIKMILKPEPFNNYVKHPDTTDAYNYGKYLVNAKYSCFDCHSKNSVTNNYSYPEKSLGYLKGGNRHSNEQRQIIYSSNISCSNNGIGKYSLEQFYNVLLRGIKHDGNPIRNPMFPYSALDSNECKSIYLYLNSCNCD